MNHCFNCMARLDAGQRVCPVCGHDNSVTENPETALPEGTVLAGKYIVGKVLGQGGFGITYLGFDTTLNVTAAIKEYFPYGIGIRKPNSLEVTSLASKQKTDSFRKGCDEFQEEARRLAAIDSPNIVKVREYFRENGTAYIVMNYLGGNSLTGEAAECGGRMPWQRVVELFNPLILELGKLHERQLIHRDIKPDNLKVIKEKDGTERLVLLDFGNARSYISAEVTGTYTAMLTAGYAPIEQYSRKSRQGPYTDIYALCASMYAVITGILPAAATDRVTGEARLQSFGETGIDMPPQIAKAILHGLEVRGSDRPQSMRELYNELNRKEPLPRSVPAAAGRPAPEPLKEERREAVRKSTGEAKPKKAAGWLLPLLLAAALAAGIFFCRGMIRDRLNLPGTQNAEEASNPGIGAYNKGEYVKALKYLRPAAEAGDAEAQYYLGRMYRYGYGVEQSYEEAVKWYQLAADQGYARAQNNLGVMYSNGFGVEQSKEEAVKWYQLAADQGYARAQTNLGYMYEIGHGVDQSYEEAVKWYQLAADQGYARAQTNLGYMYKVGHGVEQSYEEAVKWYQLAADQGYARAQNNLGIMYENGYGVEQSYEEAVKWYQLAADQGYATAQNLVGTMYYYGRGVAQSYEEAVNWYQLAADQGNAGAQNNLGWMYQNGYGVEQSYEEAVMWYQLSADQGIAAAKYHLGQMYENGYGVEQSYEEAVRWYQLSADQGNGSAQYRLGRMYEHGYGVDQSYEEAVKWFQLSAEQGNSNGQNNLGWMYENGYGVDQSYEEAVKWFQLSAEQGNSNGQNALGRMYENGYGIIDQSYEEAVKWYRLAAEQGDWNGQNNLGRMYENGYGVDQSYEEAVKWYQLAADKGHGSAKKNLKNLLEKYPALKEAAENTPVPQTAYPSADLSAGDMITLGRYEQDGNTANGAEAVEWQVLAAEDGRALLISRYALDAGPYNETDAGVTWETCTLRTWLNIQFYYGAFSNEERGWIRQESLGNPDNPEYGTKGGNDTTDRIFLLSIEEADKYFPDDGARSCQPAIHAKNKGAYVSETTGTVWWWLRSPGYTEKNAAIVNPGGNIGNYGSSIRSANGSIRPAFWLEL